MMVAEQPPRERNQGLGAAVFRSSIWGLLGHAGVLVASLLATPLTIRLLGAEQYGLLALVNSLIGYLAFSDFGMERASTRFAAEAFADGDRAKEAAVLWTTLSINLVPTIFAALALGLAAPLLVTDVFHLSPSLERTAVLALRWSAVGFALRGISGVLNTPQLVRMRFDISTAIMTASSICQIVLIPVVLLANGGLVGAVALIAALNACTVVANLVAARHLAPWTLKPTVRLELFRPLLRFGGSVVVSSIAAVLLLNSEKLFLTRFASVEALAFYSVAFSLTSVLVAAASAMSQSYLPAFSLLAGNEAERERLFQRAIRVTLIWSLPTAVIAVVAAKPFVAVWAGAQYARESVVPFYILVAGLLFNLLAFVPYNLLMSQRPGVIARCHLLEIGPYLIAGALFTLRWGATGAALAWSLRVALDAVLLFAAAKRLYRLDVPKRAIASLLPGGSLLVAPLLGLALGWPAAVNLVLALTSALGYAVVVWRTVLTGEERSWLQNVIAGQLRRGRHEGA